LTTSEPSGLASHLRDPIGMANDARKILNECDPTHTSGDNSTVTTAPLQRGGTKLRRQPWQTLTV